MPVISKFYGIIVRMMKLPGRRLAIYANYGEQEVVLDLATLTVIAGTAPTRVVEMVVEWARQHHAELMHAMEQGVATSAPMSIAPLQ